MSLERADIAIFEEWFFALAMCASQVTTYSAAVSATFKWREF